MQDSTDMQSLYDRTNLASRRKPAVANFADSKSANSATSRACAPSLRIRYDGVCEHCKPRCRHTSSQGTLCGKHPRWKHFDVDGTLPTGSVNSRQLAHSLCTVLQLYAVTAVPAAIVPSTCMYVRIFTSSRRFPRSTRYKLWGRASEPLQAADSPQQVPKSLFRQFG